MILHLESVSKIIKIIEIRLATNDQSDDDAKCPFDLFIKIG